MTPEQANAIIRLTDPLLWRKIEQQDDEKESVD
jgi:hypothetical protein